MQVALQVAPPPQFILAPVHGSGWQVPPRHTWPVAQVAAHPPVGPPELPADPVPVPLAPATPLAPPSPLTLPPVPVTGCPALPVDVAPPPPGVPVAPPPPTVTPPEVPACPPILPDDDPEPQPSAAEPDRTTSQRLVRIAAGKTDRARPGVLVIVPPEA